jgi:hypothetical protein
LLYILKTEKLGLQSLGVPRLPGNRYRKFLLAR